MGDTRPPGLGYRKDDGERSHGSREGQNRQGIGSKEVDSQHDDEDCTHRSAGGRSQQVGIGQGIANRRLHGDADDRQPRAHHARQQDPR